MAGFRGLRAFRVSWLRRLGPFGIRGLSWLWAWKSNSIGLRVALLGDSNGLDLASRRSVCDGHSLRSRAALRDGNNRRLRLGSLSGIDWLIAGRLRRCWAVRVLSRRVSVDS